MHPNPNVRSLEQDEICYSLDSSPLKDVMGSGPLNIHFLREVQCRVYLKPSLLV